MCWDALGPGGVPDEWLGRVGPATDVGVEDVGDAGVPLDDVGPAFGEAESTKAQRSTRVVRVEVENLAEKRSSALSASSCPAECLANCEQQNGGR